MKLLISIALFFTLTLCTITAKSQIQLSIARRGAEFQSLIDLAFCDVYIQTGDTSFFLEKTGKYDFLISQDILKVLQPSKEIKIIVCNDKYTYTLGVADKEFKNNPKVMRIAISNKDKNCRYTISYCWDECLGVTTQSEGSPRWRKRTVRDQNIPKHR